MEKIILKVGNIWTYISANFTLDKELIKAMRDDLSYTIDVYIRAKKGFVSVKKSIFDKKELRYPTGCFSQMIKLLDEFEIEWEIHDKRIKPKCGKELPIYGKKMRPYQTETIEKAIEAQRGIIKIATGGGKTTIGAAIIGKLNVKTLFIVNSVDLLEQAYDEFVDMLQIPIGRVGGGYCDIERITVCTIQTLHSALGLEYEAVDDECHIKEKIEDKTLTRKKEIQEMIESCEMIINDETQHSSASSYVNMMKAATNAFWRYGLSATPWKYESIDILLQAYSGKEIININASCLIKEGYLVKPKIYILDPNLLNGYKFIRKTYRTIYKEWIIENKMRNNLIVDCVKRFLELNKTTLITVTQVKHGKALLKLLEDKIEGIKAAFIHGEVNKEQRKELLNSIRSRNLQVLIGTVVADEGLNLPALDAAIIAGGGKSLIKTLQRVGRTLRLSPETEKEEAIIVDFHDHVRYLTGHAKKRIKIYKQEPEFEIIEHF